MANTLKSRRKGAVGFIEWLDDSRSTQRRCGATSSEDKKTYDSERLSGDNQRDDPEP